MVKAKEVIKAILTAPVRVVVIPIGIIICVPQFVIVIIKGMGIIGIKMLAWTLGYEPDIIDDKEAEEKIQGMINKFKERRNERKNKVSKS